MRKVFALLILVLIVITACNTKEEISEFPPEPEEPGTGNAKIDIKTGAARYVPSGYAPPEDIFNDDQQIFFLGSYLYNIEPEREGFTVSPRVEHEEAYVYKYGYIWSNDNWERFEFPQKTSGGSNWISETGSTDVYIPVNSVRPGENYVIAYSCKKHDNKWKCGCRSKYDCGYWMLNTFVYRNVDLPPEPEEPDSPTVMRIYLSPSNYFVEEGKPISVYLNFDTSQDISESLDDDIPVRITDAEGEEDMVVLERKGSAQCYQNDEKLKFSCEGQFFAEYIPKKEGEYKLSLIDESEELPDHIKVYEGAFDTLTSEELDDILIRKDIGGYTYDSSVGVFGWYSDDMGLRIYDGHYSKEDSMNNVRIYEGDDAKSMYFDDWRKYSGDDIEEEVFMVGETEHTVYVYNYQTDSSATIQSDVRWASGNKVIQIDGWSISEDYDFNTEVFKRYLVRYPTARMSNEPCSDSDNGDYNMKGTTNLVSISASLGTGEWTDVCLRDYSKYLSGEYEPGASITEDNGLLEGKCGSIRDEPGLVEEYNCPNRCEDGRCVRGGDFYKFEESGDKLNLYQSLDTMERMLTDEHLTTLKNSVFNGKTTESYTQSLKMPVGDSEVVWDVFNDIDEDPRLYLKFAEGQDILNYELGFGNSPVASAVDISSHLEDFEGSSLSILGREYSVIHAIEKSDNILLILMGGRAGTLADGGFQDFFISGTNYEVTVLEVGKDSSGKFKTRFIVKGSVTPDMYPGDIYTLPDGIKIGVKDILPSKSENTKSYVEFFMQATKITLDGDDESMDIGDNANIKDVKVIISTGESGSDISLYSIGIIWSPNVDLYVPSGSTLKESMKNIEEIDYYDFLNALDIDFVFIGMESVSKDLVKLGRNDDKSIKIQFTSKNGNDYDVPIFYVDSSGIPVLGSESDKALYVEEDAIACDEEMFIVENDDSTRILQIKEVKHNDNDKYVKIKDMGTGQTETYNFQADDYTDFRFEDESYEYEVKWAGDSNPYCVELTELTDDSDDRADIWTKRGIEISLRGGTSERNILFREKEKEDDGDQDSFAFNATWDSDEGVANLGSVIVESGTEYDFRMIVTDEDSSVSQGYTKYGTYLERDTSSDQDEWLIKIPEEEAVTLVYLTSGNVELPSEE